MPKIVELRGAGSDDLPFLFTLYCDVRGPEVDAWGWPQAQRNGFLRMQFEGQRRSYEAAYPQAMHHIVSLGQVQIGRILVARIANGMHLVDIALLAAHRNQGIGTQLIQQLIGDCAKSGCALHLHVLRGNPAQHLYQRMGFNETAADPIYTRMTWHQQYVQPAVEQKQTRNEIGSE